MIEEIVRVYGVPARIVVEGNMGAIGVITKYDNKKQIARIAPHVLARGKSHLYYWTWVRVCGNANDHHRSQKRR